MKDFFFSYQRINVYELSCFCPTNKQLTVYLILHTSGGLGALQARLHQPISGSGEEAGAEDFETESIEGLQSRLGAGPQGGKMQTKEELHNTRSAQW